MYTSCALGSGGARSAQQGAKPYIYITQFSLPEGYQRG